jgi:ribonucleoside-diphosphate reductase alpha chain
VTDDADIRTASSIIDYIFKRLGKTYLSFDNQLEVGLANIDDMPSGQASLLDEVEVAEEITHAEQEIAAEPDLDKPTSTSVSSSSTSYTVSTSVPAREISAAASTTSSTSLPPAPNKKAARDESAPLCYNCGNQTQRAGTCYVCTACGSTTGCS